MSESKSNVESELRRQLKEVGIAAQNAQKGCIRLERVKPLKILPSQTLRVSGEKAAKTKIYQAQGDNFPRVQQLKREIDIANKCNIYV